jgi:hypothetical protein
VRQLYRKRVALPLTVLAVRVGDAFEECAFRLALAFEVLVGRLPMVRPRRWWNRATEPPTLIDVRDFTDERLIYSVLVWPPLEGPVESRERDHHERVHQVIRVLHAGATDMAWSTRYGVDEEGLRWDHERGVWEASDGYAFDGERLYEYSREGANYG